MDVKVKKLKNYDNKKEVSMTLSVQRSYKNSNVAYDTDLVPCILWNDIADKTTEYCYKGDIVIIRGQIRIENKAINIIVEKISFLTSNKTSLE